MVGQVAPQVVAVLLRAPAPPSSFCCFSLSKETLRHPLSLGFETHGKVLSYVCSLNVALLCVDIHQVAFEVWAFVAHAALDYAFPWQVVTLVTRCLVFFFFFLFFRFVFSFRFLLLFRLHVLVFFTVPVLFLVFLGFFIILLNSLFLHLLHLQEHVKG